MSTAPSFSADRMGILEMGLEHMNPGHSVIDAKNQESVKQLYEQMAKMPWQPASFVSFHAFQLYFSNPLANELRLAAAPLATDERFSKVVLRSGRKLGYTHHVFSMFARNQVPNDAGQVDVRAILPIDLALDFIGQDSGMNRGGVVCYEGSDAPEVTLGNAPNTIAYVRGDRTGATRGLSMSLVDALEYVHELQLKHYLEWHEKAEEAASGTEATRRNVIHRSNVLKMARMLRAWGELSADPVYMKAPTKSSAEPVFCKSCGKESAPGAMKCTNGSCTYVFHPFLAFKDDVIDLDTPGAGLALRRLAPPQVRQLINWKKFTQEEAVEAGYRKPITGKASEADTDTEPVTE